MRRDDDDARFTMTWTEAGGPRVEPPQRTGFGSTVLGRMAEANLDAQIAFRFEPGGVEWHLDCPLDRATGRTDGHAMERRIVRPDVAPSDGDVDEDVPRLLVVEDDWLVARDVVKALEDRGREVLGPVASVAGALSVLDRVRVHAAILDVNLGRELSEPIAMRLAEDGTPYVVLSGYDGHQIPPTMRSVPGIGEPVRLDLFLAEIERVLRTASGD